VPKGYEALLPYLRKDADLRKNFFSRLRVLWFAAATLPQYVFDEMKNLAYETCGAAIPFFTGFGATETAPHTLGRHWETENVSNMGLPPPGVELKLIPLDDKYEARVKGPHVTPGYWRQPELTRAAFDEEGFYRLGGLGDSFVFERPEEGLLFRGRIAEDFKLSTGTFVSVGTLRPKLLSASGGLLADAVLCGADGPSVTAMVWLSAPHAGRVDADGVPEDSLRADLVATMQRLAAESTGSSQHVERLLVLTEPAQLDAGEVTDKGYVNQAAVRDRRADLVALLTADPLPSRIVVR